MSRRQSRRRFLQSSAAAGAGVFLTQGFELPSSAAQPANNRLNIAVIGCGGQGGSDLGNVSGENIVALCDVDSVRAAGAFNNYPKVPKFTDFRVMLDKMGKQIDAVTVSTPDHTHAVASITAMKMGKHCYTQKPLTHDVYEARQMKIVAAKHKVQTQMGNQGTARDGFRTGVEVLRAGIIGDVREIHIWTNRPIWPQNINRPKGAQPVFKSLEWDLWLGTAPERPFYHGNAKPGQNGTYLPFSWRGWWDFGTGAIGDMACHTMNLAFMGLRLGAPTSVVADVDPKGNLYPNETAPVGCTVTFEFPARGKLPPCRLTWYERRRPNVKLMMGENQAGSGCLIIGSRGTLYSPDDYGERQVLLPRADFANFKPPERTLPRASGQSHHAEWIRACKGQGTPMSNFVDYASQLTETALLGDVAIRVGKRVVWDAENLRATDLPAADQYIRREYRKGWSL